MPRKLEARGFVSTVDRLKARRNMRSISHCLAAACGFGMVGVLLWGFVRPPQLAGLPEAAPDDRAFPMVDFDGDGKVSPWEEINVELWVEDENLSKVLAQALPEGSVLPSGAVDISEYLNALQKANSTEGTTTLLESGGCDTDWICCFARGDADRVNGIDLTDSIFILNYLFLGGDPPPCMDAADVNDDGVINSTDATYLQSHLFSGGPEPPAPYPTWGQDPTYDTIELPCQDLGDFEHARGPLDLREIVLPPTEDVGLPSGLLPEAIYEPSDGTGGFSGIAPQLEIFPAPGGLAWGFQPSYRTRYVDRRNEAAPTLLDSEVGTGWFSGIPHLVDAGPEEVEGYIRYWIRWSAGCVRGYKFDEDNDYVGRFTNETVLRYVPGDDTFHLLDLSGRTYVFRGYGEDHLAAKGRLWKVEGLGGVTVSQTVEKPEIECFWDTGGGTLARVEVRVPGETEPSQEWTYAYSSGRLTGVSLERPDGSIPYQVSLRRWASGSGEVGGTTDDVMQIDVTTDLSPIEDPAQNPPETITRSTYFRYYEDEWSDTNGLRGYPHQIRHVWGPDACAELVEAQYRADPSVTAVADREYTYCQDRRVRSLSVRGVSCAGCGGGGQGEYSYTWYLGKTQADAEPSAGADLSHVQVAIELPHDGQAQTVRQIICFNAYGQKLVDAKCVQPDAQSSELAWVYAAEYGTTTSDAWYPLHQLWPSAMESFQHTAGTALDCSPQEEEEAPAFTGNGALVSYSAASGAGRHLEYTYEWTTADILKIVTGLGEGRSTTSDLVSEVSYRIYEDSSVSDRRRVVVVGTGEYEDNSTVHTTSYTSSGAFSEDPLVFEVQQTAYPVVPTSQHGSGSAIQEFLGMDSLGQVRFRKDGDGRVTYVEYDPVTSQPALVVEDVDTTSPPSGVVLPSVPSQLVSTGSDRLNAVTVTTYDPLGRVVSVERPGGLADNNSTERRRRSWFVYAKLAGPSYRLSAEEPVTIHYPHVDIDSGMYTPLGEVGISVRTPGGRSRASARAYLPGAQGPYFYAGHWQWVYPASSLDEVFSGASLVLLERSETFYSHDATDDHLIVTQKAWSTPESSTPNEDFTTTTHYNLQGLPGRVVGRTTAGASGFREISRTYYDPLGRAARWAIGSNDAGEADPPGSTSGTNDLVSTRQVYRDGADSSQPLVVGDGHVTLAAAHLGDTAGTTRWTKESYDFRGLLKERWRGFYPTLGTAEAIDVYEHDRQGRTLAAKTYEEAIQASRLRAFRTTSYDPMGRSFLEEVFGVEPAGPSAGQIRGVDDAYIPLRSKQWYDGRGNTIKSEGPGGVFQKSQFDGLSRMVAEYTCYHNAEADNDPTAHGNVVGDTVVEQSERTLDKAGNLLFVKSYQRYPESTGSGALDSASARVSYRAAWHDVLGKVEVEADYGDNGGQTLSARPTTRPTATTALVRVRAYVYPESLNQGRRWSMVTAVDGQVFGKERDALGRTIRTWTRGSGSTDFRVRDLGLDSLGHTIVRTVYQDAVSYAGSLPPTWTTNTLIEANPSQTAYDWGVLRDDVSQGTSWDDNLVTSTGLLGSIRFPDRSDGSPVVGASLVLAYNAQGERRASELRKSANAWIGHELLRDDLGSIYADQVHSDDPEPGPTALEWERDALGRLLRARSLDGTTVLNDVEYTYGAWSEVTYCYQAHDSAVSTVTSPRARYIYEGPKMIGSGGTSHPIVRRQRYEYAYRSTGTSVTTAARNTLYYYDTVGEVGEIPDMLSRPSSIYGVNYSPVMQTKVIETFLGAGRWVKTESQRYSSGWSTELTQEIPEFESPGDGLDRFGAPREFKASHSESEVPLRRTYSYSDAGRITAAEDFKTESGTEVALCADAWTYDAFGRVETYTHEPLPSGNPAIEGGPPVSRGWSRDAAGNWACFSGDGGSQANPCAVSRVIDGRGEIEEIDDDEDAVAYDEAGRITGHDFPAPGVSARFVYDAWNRLVGFGPPGDPEPPLTVTFEYDALGRLIERTENSSTVHVYYDASGRRMWEGPDETTVTWVEFSSPASGRPYVVFGSMYWPTIDALNQPTGMATDQGIVSERYWLDPSGMPFWWTPSGAKPINRNWSGWHVESDVALLLSGTGVYSAILGESLAPPIIAVRGVGRAPEANQCPQSASKSGSDGDGLNIIDRLKLEIILFLIEIAPEPKDCSTCKGCAVGTNRYSSWLTGRVTADASDLVLLENLSELTVETFKLGGLGVSIYSAASAQSWNPIAASETISAALNAASYLVSEDGFLRYYKKLMIATGEGIISHSYAVLTLQECVEAPCFGPSGDDCGTGVWENQEYITKYSNNSVGETEEQFMDRMDALAEMLSRQFSPLDDKHDFSDWWEARSPKPFPKVIPTEIGP